VNNKSIKNRGKPGKPVGMNKMMMGRLIIKSFYSFRILVVYIFTTIFISIQHSFNGFYPELRGPWAANEKFNESCCLRK
jgi:hypothetical protein